MVIIGVIGLFNPVGLGPPADPMDTPAHTKPEWYFLFLYQLLKFIPKEIGASAPVVALLLLAVWPFIDSKPDKTVQARRIRWIVSAVVLLAITALTTLAWGWNHQAHSSTPWGLNSTLSHWSMKTFPKNPIESISPSRESVEKRR